jgi:thioredoxin-like negative regulator of GroEL
MTDPTPVAFFNEAAREAAVEAYNRAIEREPTRHVKSLNAALTAALEALPERSKAILALAELSDEELVERVARAILRGNGRRDLDDQGRALDARGEPLMAESGHARDVARAVLTALGLPVGQQTTESEGR